MGAGFDPFTAKAITGPKPLSMLDRSEIVDTPRMAEALEGV